MVPETSASLQTGSCSASKVEPMPVAILIATGAFTRIGYNSDQALLRTVPPKLSSPDLTFRSSGNFLTKRDIAFVDAAGKMR